MDAFSYDNIWMTLSLWGILITAITFLFLTLLGKEDKNWLQITAWSVFTVSVGFMIAVGIFAHERDTESVAYQQQVRDHIQNTAGFDSVEGELKFEPAEISTYTVKTGEMHGDCYAVWPESGTGALQFGCGPDFSPLEEGKTVIRETGEPVQESEQTSEAAQK